MKKNKPQPLSIGDRIFITAGKYKGQRGILQGPTGTRGEYLCQITSLHPNQVEIINTSQFCKNSIKKVS